MMLKLYNIYHGDEFLTSQYLTSTEAQQHRKKGLIVKLAGSMAIR